jgi:putative Mg2+ transporter-C (MgtC) family protein
MLTEKEIVLRLLLGAVLGGVIGIERQTHGRPAGFRTQLLVCVASVLLMIVSEYYYQLSMTDNSYMRIDPNRIAAGAITGVGFLGAGVILKMGSIVLGLTTAACIWMVSAIGLAIGAGLYLAGITAFGITLFSLIALRTVENRMRRLEFRSIKITASEGFDPEQMESLLSGKRLKIINIDYEKNIPEAVLSYTVSVSFKDGISVRGLLDELSSLKAVRRVSITG